MEPTFLAAKQAFTAFLTAYLVHRDAANTLALTSDNIFISLLGQFETIETKEELGTFLEEKVKADPTPFLLEHLSIDGTTESSNCVYLHATLKISKSLPNGQAFSVELCQWSTLHQKEGSSFLLSSLHTSVLSEESSNNQWNPFRFFAENRLMITTDYTETQSYSLPGGILKRTTDEGCQILFLSDDFLSLVGFTKEEIGEQFHHCFLEMVHPHDVPYVKNTISQQQKENKTIQLEYRLMTHSGKAIWVLERSERVYENGSYFLYCIIMEITQKKEMDTRLRMNEKRLQIAISKTKYVIFEYILKNRTVYHINKQGELYGLAQKVEDVPYSLLEKGVVLPESADDFIHMYQKIDSGAAEASCVIHTKTADNHTLWNRITLTNLFDDKGNPVRAIGIIEDITQEKEAKLAKNRESLYRNAILIGSVIFFEFNITQDILERHTDHSQGLAAEGNTYTEILKNTIENLLHPDDQDIYFQQFHRSHVLSAFEDGIREIKQEHRRIDPQGNAIWMQTTLYLVQDTQTHDIKGFSYLKNIDEQKRSELLLKFKSQRDALTRLYNKESTESRIKSILKKNTSEQLHAFMMIDVDNFKQINDTYGHKYGDTILIEISRHIGDIFRGDDIIGRVGGDEFVIFVKDIISTRLMDEKASDICHIFHQIALEQKKATDLSCSIGISICPNHGITFDELYEKADIALYEAKNMGRNRFVYYHPNLPSIHHTEHASSLEDEETAATASVAKPLGKRNSLPSYLQGNKRLMSSILLLVVICTVVFGGTSAAYLNYLNRVVNQENWRYISEISNQMSVLLKNQMDTDLKAVEDTASFLEKMEDNSEEALDKVLNEKTRRWGLWDFALLSKDGQWYHYKNKQHLKYFKHQTATILENRKNANHTPVYYDGENSILIVHPVADITYEGQDIVAVAGLRVIDNIDTFLNLNSFHIKNKAFIIDSRGRIISSSTHSTPTIYPLEEIAKLKMTYGTSYEKMVSDMSLRKQGYVKFSYKHNNYYLCYTPVGVWNWYLLSVFPDEAVNTSYHLLFRINVVICITITILFLMLFLALLIANAKKKQQLELLAYLDPVTGGSNKQHFEALAWATLQKRQYTYALIYTNIRRFKVLNERFGRNMTDQILKSVYNIISLHLNEGELIGRLTSDNFGLLLIFNGRNNLEERLSEINEEIRHLSSPSGLQYHIQMSYGVYLPDSTDTDIITMLDRANLACKQHNTSAECFQLYDHRFKERMVREKQLEDKMYGALKHKDFIVYLQPKVELKQETIAGAEALVRWNDPVEGMIYPNDFIPLFERNGFITQVDFYVFEVVCSTIKKWIQAGEQPITISVNLSKANMDTPDCLKQYWKKMEEYDIPPQCIEFEFTETLAYDNMHILSTLIQEIHNHGCTCSMDDFGSGYSSLNMLKNVNVDTLKLDKAFFDELGKKDSRGREIIKGIISLAKELSLQTVSEGVETREQVDFLKEIQGDLVQGYVFSRPIPIDAFEKMAFQKIIK